MRLTCHAWAKNEMRTKCYYAKRKKLRNRSLERPKRRCKANTEMDLRETGSESVDWIQLAQHMVQYKHSGEICTSIQRDRIFLTV